MTTPVRRTTLLALAVVVGGFALLAASGAATGRPLPRTADRSNAGQYTVPAGVHHVTVVLLGASGTGGALCSVIGGPGGEISADLPVTPGEILQLNTGVTQTAGLSGNASDVRRAPYGLDDRLVVAGGGGWDSQHAQMDVNHNCTTTRSGGGLGGPGGNLVGGHGTGAPASCSAEGGVGGYGGTQVAGGAGGPVCGGGASGVAGTFGFGGGPGVLPLGKAPCDGGGWGGDGWYGGGGGASSGTPDGSPGGCVGAVITGGGGGGGSSYAEPTATHVVFHVGVNHASAGYVGILSAAQAGVPTVTGVAAKAGPTAGGRLVTVTGSNFTGNTRVRFGSTPGRQIFVISSSQLTVRSPGHSAGVVHVRTTTLGGSSASIKADRYTYLKRPKLTSLSPGAGPKRGGTTVTVLGHHFTGGSTVTFDGKAGSHVVVLSATRLRVRSPAHAAGVVDVQVTTFGGRSAAGSDDRFRYR